MKSLKNFKNFIFLIATLLVSLTTMAGPTNVGEMNIHGLDHFRGLMLSVFYVSARPSGIGTVGATPRVREVIKVAGPFEIHGQGKPVNVPKTTLITQGFTQFNYVFYVVHSPYLDQVGIRNLDGSIPKGQPNLDTTREDETSPFNHRYDFNVDKLQLNQEMDKRSGVINLVVIPRINNYQNSN